MSIVAIAIRCTTALDEADNFHREVAAPAG
jgi:hypothetical protein